MPRTRSPKHGTMGVWPRKRAIRIYSRIRSWPASDKAKPLGFAGYKVGMATVMIKDYRKHLKKKTTDLAIPVTIIECPPLKIASVRFYKETQSGLRLSGEIYGKVEKELDRKIPIPKKFDEKKLDSINPGDYDDIRLNVYTQPKMTGIGKKKPELFEMALGGKLQDKLAYAKENLGKEIFLKDIFAGGQQIDFHGVTKGKGFQGPMKRFGIGRKSHKAEKGVRNVGSLGGWKAQGHFMYRVAHAGQTGFHSRTEYNKWIVKIDDSKDINPKAGFMHYGNVKSTYMLVKGSVFGPVKRIVRFNIPLKPSSKIPKQAPEILEIVKL